MKNNDIKISKFLSYVLRHKPEAIGLVLDENGWAKVDELLVKAAADGMKFSLQDLERVVDNNDKQRFSFCEDGEEIRANQGHSIDIDLQLEPIVPPEILFHGTVERFKESILKEGLKKGNRQYVHLSKDIETATKVGSRRGKPIILKIRAGQMHKDGKRFYVSKNGVWLAEYVPAEYIKDKE